MKLSKIERNAIRLENFLKFAPATALRRKKNRLPHHTTCSCFPAILRYIYWLGKIDDTTNLQRNIWCRIRTFSRISLFSVWSATSSYSLRTSFKVGFFFSSSFDQAVFWFGWLLHLDKICMHSLETFIPYCSLEHFLLLSGVGLTLENWTSSFLGPRETDIVRYQCRKIVVHRAFVGCLPFRKLQILLSFQLFSIF